MTNTAPLDERIATALAGRPSSSELGKLLDAAKVADRQAEIDLAAASDRALDPATPPTKVAEARQVMADAQFMRDRLSAGSKRLAELRVEADRREREERRQVQVGDLTGRRDAMADELRTAYPKLAAGLLDLLQRMTALDAECRQFGVMTSEDAARPGHMLGGQPATPLGAARIVAFERRFDGWLWPTAAGTAAAPRAAIIVATKRVILTNRQAGPRAAVLANGTYVSVEPGQSSGEVLMAEPDLPGARGHLEVKELGPGAPVQRAAA